MKYTVLSEEREFLETVLADPDDASARLVYADWLEGYGDRRAEWLRLELEFHGLTSMSHRHRPLRKKLRALLPKMDPEWARAVTRDMDEVVRPKLRAPEPTRAPTLYERLHATITRVLGDG